MSATLMGAGGVGVNEKLAKFSGGTRKLIAAISERTRTRP
jgi:hypothetical protein